jgi:hypothetical protein
MYSLSILSLPADLPFFNFCTTDFISSAVMEEFKISSISGERLSILISISILLLSLSIFVFRFLK